MMNIPKYLSAESRIWFEDSQSAEWFKDWLIGLGVQGSFILYVKLAILLLLLFLLCYVINLKIYRAHISANKKIRIKEF